MRSTWRPHLYVLENKYIFKKSIKNNTIHGTTVTEGIRNHYIGLFSTDMKVMMIMMMMVVVVIVMVMRMVVLLKL